MSIAQNPKELGILAPLDIVANVSVAASAAAGVATYADFVQDPAQPTVTTTEIRAPPDEQWIIERVYSPIQTPALDGYVQFKANQKEQNINYGPLSQTYPDLFNSKKMSKKFVVKPNGSFQLRYINSAANTTTAAVSVLVNVEFTRIPANYSGKVPLTQ